MRTTDLSKVRATLWAAVDELRANSKLTPVQYRDPVLGLVFLAYAENRFEGIKAEVELRASARNPATVADYKAKSVLYVPDESRLSFLVGLPEGDDIGKAVDDAIKAIESTNPELKDILPRGYQKLERPTLIELLRLFAPLPTQLEGDAFGFIYEDFPSNFADQEGKGGGEYFIPYSIVRLIVEILEPFQGRVFDPACGSDGMFVQCAEFVERHHESATRNLSAFGTEKTEHTLRRLIELSQTLTAEEERAVREGMTEEELAIFDLLTQPDPVLTAEERETVKASAEPLLEHLHEKIVKDWRRKVATTNDVSSTIRRVLDQNLPEVPYTVDIFHTKVQLVFDHVLTAYGDNGESAYSPRIDFSYPSDRVRVEYTGPIDVNKVADDVVARIHADPTFAAQVAQQLRAAAPANGDTA